jgi:hypothetical protein
MVYSITRQAACDISMRQTRWMTIGNEIFWNLLVGR